MSAWRAGMLSLQAGRVVQVGLVTSRTTRAVVLESSATVAGGGTAGATFGARVGVGVGVGATVGGGAVVAGAAVVGTGVGEGTAAGVVHAATRAIAAIAGITRRIAQNMRSSLTGSG
jgi:hypothetical protein